MRATDEQVTGRYIRRLVLPLSFLAVFVSFAVQNEYFLGAQNLRNLASQAAPTVIVATAVAVLMAAGYLDLSVGSTFALSGVVSLAATVPLGAVGGAIAGLAVGVVIGLTNGILVGVLRFPALVVTLGTLVMLRSIASSADSLVPQQLPKAWGLVGATNFVGLPLSAWIALAFVVFTAGLISITPLGSEVIALNGGANTVRLSGVAVARVAIGVYVLTGLASALAAELQVARLGAAPGATLGTGLEVLALTSVVFAGVNLRGRTFMIRAALVAFLFMALRNGLILTGGLPSTLITGGGLIAAAALDRLYSSDGKHSSLAVLSSEADVHDATGRRARR